MQQQYGTPYYIAPEVVLQGGYNEKCDLWSIGVILYIMLSGRPPFNSSSEEGIIEKVKVGRYDFKAAIWDKVSAEAKDLITKLLQKDVNKRLSALDALQHPWIKNQVKSKFNLALANDAVSNLSSFQVSSIVASSCLISTPFVALSRPNRR